MRKRVFIYLFFFFFTTIRSFAQIASDSVKTQSKDIVDFFTRIPKIESNQVEFRKLYMPFLPLVGYTPANGFILGAAALPSISLDSVSHTRMSSMMINVQLTSKKQLNMNVRSNIYLSHDRWILQGDWRFLFYSQPTYGLGIYDFPPGLQSNKLLTTDTEGAQPMRFNYFRLYQKVYKQIVSKFYAGVGIGFDFYDNIKDEKLYDDSQYFTSHYNYSLKYDYQLENYKNLGATFNLLYDTRDNSMNTYSGSYFDMSYFINPDISGFGHDNSRISLDLRKYIKLYQKNNPHFLALMFLSDVNVDGQAPYLSLPSIGWDTYNRSGRGFVQGRYRGDDLVYGEIEYRFPISRNGFLGGVAFVNTLSVSSNIDRQPLFEKSVFGYGGGVRVRVDKITRVNICIDYARGPQNKGLIYFGMQEAF